MAKFPVGSQLPTRRSKLKGVDTSLFELLAVVGREGEEGGDVEHHLVVTLVGVHRVEARRVVWGGGKSCDFATLS